MYNIVTDSKIQQEIHEYCNNKRIVVNEQTGEIIFLPCRRAKCRCDYCRREWSRLLSLRLQRQAKVKPYDFFACLKFTGKPYVDPATWDVWRKKMYDTIRQRKCRNKWRDSGLYFTFDLIIEFTPKGNDFNFLIRTNMFKTAQECKAFLRPIIMNASNNTKLYLEVGRPKFGQKVMIKYATKDVTDRSNVACPPEEWKGKKLFIPSKMF